jgi:hypothetical protein
LIFIRIGGPSVVLRADFGNPCNSHINTDI